MAGDWELGVEILGNMAMFVPFGFMLMSLFRRKGKAVLIIALAVGFSLMIETSQLLLMRGLFEWDDLISNGLGAVLGCLAYSGAKRIVDEDKFSTVVFLTGVVFTIVCAGVFIGGRDGGEEVDNTSRAYCFQIDEAEVDGERITVTGFAFRYEREPVPVRIVLQSTDSGERIRLDTKQVARPDVQQYFLCEYDYEFTGFVATGAFDPADEYEVLIQWPWTVPVSTGVFVTGSDVHYVAEKDWIAPEAENTDLEPIVKNGVLRVYQPENRCWVYQYDGGLYWIADQDFCFEADQKTYIQYQLYTTQTENLPAHRLEHNYLWDNIGAYFETNELTGDFGVYRVMRREIPAEYAITSILTGYYRDGNWVWKRYFRPYYEF